MGEMVVEKMREEISSVVIIRPTIITSTYKEPFPGWAEGIRTIDSLAVGYGKGRLTCFLGDLKAVVDVVSHLLFQFFYWDNPKKITLVLCFLK